MQDVSATLQDKLHFKSVYGTWKKKLLLSMGACMPTKQPILFYIRPMRVLAHNPYRKVRPHIKINTDQRCPSQ